MLNNASAQAASLAANKNISGQKNLVRDNYRSDRSRFETVSAMMKAIADRTAPIAEYFSKVEAMGQQYVWLEANLVFEVARLLARMDVPALTVHDELIVPVDMVEALHEVRHTTAFTDFWCSCATWRVELDLILILVKASHVSKPANLNYFEYRIL